jgi:hypothetical protein
VGDLQGDSEYLCGCCTRHLKLKRWNFLKRSEEEEEEEEDEEEVDF